jgi:hypothetical protein
MENYEIVKDEIGSGKFGKASLVKHKKTGRVMVWKKVNYSQMKEKEK